MHSIDLAQIQKFIKKMINTTEILFKICPLKAGLNIINHLLKRLFKMLFEANVT